MPALWGLPPPRGWTAFLSWGWPQEAGKPRPPAFSLDLLSGTESLPLLTRAARKQLFLPWWQVRSRPGQEGPHKPHSGGFFLLSPCPALPETTQTLSRALPGLGSCWSSQNAVGAPRVLFPKPAITVPHPQLVRWEDAE